MKKILLPILLVLLVAACSPKVGFEVNDLLIQGLPRNVQVLTTGHLLSADDTDLICGIDSSLLIYRVDSDSAYLLYQQEFTDDVLLLETAVFNDAGKESLIIVTGQKRYQATEVRVFLLEVNDQWETELLYAKFSTRPHATNLVIADGNNNGIPEVIVSYFESKYVVETISIEKTNNRWLTRSLDQTRMAMTRDLGELPGYEGQQQVVGRVYGDEIGLSGDSYIVGPINKMLPTKRGVKVVRIGDVNNDGENDILVGDGWHQDYGKIARGRVAMINLAKGAPEYELIEDVKYQYEISQVAVADVNQDGLNEVLARGNQFFRIYQHKNNAWSVYRDSLIPAAVFTIGDILGDEHPEVIFGGTEMKVIQFGNIEFSDDLDPEVVTEKIFPDSLIGQPAPELSVLKWFNGSFPGLYNSKGKVIMLDFWATWCGPCIKTFPDLKRLQQSYDDQGLQILGLTKIDPRQSEQDILDFVNEEGFVYPIALSDETLNNLAYGVGAIPHVVLIDKKGMVRWYKIGAGDPADLETKIQELLAE